MNTLNRISMNRPVAAAAVLALAATAALQNSYGADDALRTRFNAGARIVWGVEANFAPTPTGSLLDAVGPGTLGTPPGPETEETGPASAGGVDRTYANGFVRRDGSGNAGGLTSNWGYQNAAQLQYGHVAYDGTTGLSVQAENGRSSDPSMGFEATLQRDFFHGERVAFGILGGFNWTDVSIHSSALLSGTGSYVRDFYSLGGITAPIAPFTGSVSGPNALLSDAPIRTASIGTISVSGSRAIDGDLFGIKLGLYAEIQLCKAASIQVTAGPTVVLADANFTYSETVSYNGRTGSLAARGSNDDWLFGAFADATLNWYVTDHFTAFIGGGWQTADKLDLLAGTRAAELDLGTTWQILAGLGWRF